MSSVSVIVERPSMFDMRLTRTHGKRNRRRRAPQIARTNYRALVRSCGTLEPIHVDVQTGVGDTGQNGGNFAAN